MKHKTIRTPRIVQPNSKRWLTLFILLLILVLLSGVGVCLYFYQHTDVTSLWTNECEAAPQEMRVVDVANMADIDALKTQIALLEKERDEYRLQAARFERASQIDQQVVSTVQDDLKALQAERSGLRQQIAFLKSLVSGGITALQLLDFNIEKSEEQGIYTYMLTVSKRAKGQERVEGRLEFNIVGKQAGETKTLKNADLALTGNRLIMGFQSFQNYKGTFKLPDTFVPEIFRVKVEPRGNKFKTFEKSFPWQLIFN